MTDRIDAIMLSRFAQAVRPEVRLLPDELTVELRALVARRRHVTEMIVAETNRLSSASKTLQKRIEACFPLAPCRIQLDLHASYWVYERLHPRTNVTSISAPWQ